VIEWSTISLSSSWVSWVGSEDCLGQSAGDSNVNRPTIVGVLAILRRKVLWRHSLQGFQFIGMVPSFRTNEVYNVGNAVSDIGLEPL